jgi:hypothetical protein
MKQFLLLFFISVLFNSCKQEDDSDPALYIDYFCFGNHGNAPVTVHFQVMGTVNGTITWDFGDGATGSGAEVTHIYNTIGYYKVTARLDNGTGTASKSRYINVSPYTKIKVESIDVIAPGLKDDATEWDDPPYPSPDLYAKIFNTNGIELMDTLGYIYYPDTFFFHRDYTPDLEITGFENRFIMQVFDSDPATFADDIIGTYTFQPTDFIPADASFPDSLYQTDVFGGKVTVHISWAD